MPHLGTGNLLVAESAAMRGVVAALDDLAGSDEPVLFCGEPGSGRERMARVLHHAGGRRHGAMVMVAAHAASATLSADPCAGSILASARGGTLLVRDIGDLPRSSQQRLGALLAGGSGGMGPAGVRLVATGDVDMGRLVDRGMFEPALFARLRAIQVPPLRERPEDIAPLATAFVRWYARALDRGAVTMTSRACARLGLYPWPGNVAELKGVCRRLVVEATTDRVDIGEVEAALPATTERIPLEDISFEDMVRGKLARFLRRMDGYAVQDLYEQVLARVERPLLELVMEHTGGNQVRAAEILGLNRNTLRRKLRERGLKASVRRIRNKSRQSSSADSSGAG